MVLFGSVVEVSVLKVLSGFHSAVGHTGIYISILDIFLYDVVFSFNKNTKINI